MPTNDPGKDPPRNVEVVIGPCPCPDFVIKQVTNALLVSSDVRLSSVFLSEAVPLEGLC